MWEYTISHTVRTKVHVLKPAGVSTLAIYNKQIMKYSLPVSLLITMIEYNKCTAVNQHIIQKQSHILSVHSFVYTNS